MVTTLDSRLAEIARRARPYPDHLLETCESGLVLFAAAFAGHNDAIHFARHELVTTCVDRHRPLLRKMEAIYPDDWWFVNADAWLFAEQMREAGRSWDAVSVDTWTGGPMLRSLTSLTLWCALANKVVTATAQEGAECVIPSGWEATFFPRSGTVVWLVLTRKEGDIP